MNITYDDACPGCHTRVVTGLIDIVRLYGSSAISSSSSSMHVLDVLQIPSLGLIDIIKPVPVPD